MISTPSKLPISRQAGSGPTDVRFVQEWLFHHGHKIGVDGIFGPLTDAAVRAFQGKEKVDVTGIVDQLTWERLFAPMQRVTSMKVTSKNLTLRQWVLVFAQRHLAEIPIEIGGMNRGPWVRLYMDGHEGREWKWCAGFVNYVIRQACQITGDTIPILSSFSCNEIAINAKERGLLTPDLGRTQPGDLFLLRKEGGYSHIGIIEYPDYGNWIFHSIEGNIVTGKNREGVAAKSRDAFGKDFVLLGE